MVFGLELLLHTPSLQCLESYRMRMRFACLSWLKRLTACPSWLRRSPQPRHLLRTRPCSNSVSSGACPIRLLDVTSVWPLCASIHTCFPTGPTLRANACELDLLASRSRVWILANRLARGHRLHHRSRRICSLVLRNRDGVGASHLR